MLPHKTNSRRSMVPAHSAAAEAGHSAARGGVWDGAWARGARGCRSGRRRSRTPNPCRPARRVKLHEYSIGFHS